MHPPEVRAEALALVEAGLNDCEISRRLGIPRGIHRPQPYEYLSYHFANLSKDIIDLFTGACDLAGIHDYRVSGKASGRWAVRINRRASVALMLEHVGLKA